VISWRLNFSFDEYTYGYVSRAYEPEHPLLKERVMVDK